MKRLVVVSLVVVALAFVPVVSALAQQEGSGSGGGMKGRSQRMYDPSKAETVSGEVIGVKDFTSRNGGRKAFFILPPAKTFAKVLLNKNLDSFSPCF